MATDPIRVMAGLVPAIHVFGTLAKQDVDARDKPGHDEEVLTRSPDERSDIRG